MSGAESIRSVVTLEDQLQVVARPCDEVLDNLKEGEEATVSFSEGGVPCRVRRVDGQLIVLWKAAAAMHKKDDLRAFDVHEKIEVSRYQPFFKFVNTNGSRLVRCILVDHGYLELSPESNRFDALWTGKHIKRSLLQQFGPQQKINHFPKTYEITRKDRLFKNIHEMSKERFFLMEVSIFYPKQEHDKLRKRLHKEDQRWILKPNSSSRGRGIFILRDLLDISSSALERCVVCRYIDNPLLINGLKFDLRIYVAVTSFFPLRVWIYEEGLARFATEQYRDDGYKNPFIHLTNYSINKKSKKFALLNQDLQDEELHEAVGSKWTLTAWRRFLRESGVDEGAVWSRIEACIARALISVEGACAPAFQDWSKYRGSCFELFGFDVLIDDNLKPWVLEVNLSPSLSVESNLDFGVKSRMLCDLFSIAGFVIGEQTEKPGSSRPPFRDNYSTEDLEQMAKETLRELERSGGWKMLMPSLDASLDRYLSSSRRPAYEYIRNYCKEALEANAEKLKEVDRKK